MTFLEHLLLWIRVGCVHSCPSGGKMIEEYVGFKKVKKLIQADLSKTEFTNKYY